MEGLYSRNAGHMALDPFSFQEGRNWGRAPRNDEDLCPVPDLGHSSGLIPLVMAGEVRQGC